MPGSKKHLIIGLDFDGTCVTHEYPYIGKDIEAVPVLKELVKHGVKFVLNTMRSGETLEDAIQWFTKNKIELYGINRNPDQTWTESPKVYAHLYIDDAALGCPLKQDITRSWRPFVDWEKIREYFVNIGILEK